MALMQFQPINNQTVDKEMKPSQYLSPQKTFGAFSAVGWLRRSLSQNSDHRQGDEAIKILFPQKTLGGQKLGMLASLQLATKFELRKGL